MGVLYIIAPLDDSLADYLKGEGVTIPAAGVAGRNPTPKEIRELSARLPDKNLTVNVRPGVWQVMIEGRNDPENEPWTLLNVRAFVGDEDEPHEIWFEKGWPSVILQVVHILSARCGPLVIVPDTGCQPIVVTSADDPQMLLKTWEHTRKPDS